MAAGQVGFHDQKKVASPLQPQNPTSPPLQKQTHQHHPLDKTHPRPHPPQQHHQPAAENAHGDPTAALDDAPAGSAVRTSGEEATGAECGDAETAEGGGAGVERAEGGEGEAGSGLGEVVWEGAGGDGGGFEPGGVE